MVTQKREIFDRTQLEEVQVNGTHLVIDKVRIPVGYTRVYTVISANDGTTAPSKIRFGLHHDNSNNWYEEEPAPAINTYYTTRREYHTRMTAKGIVAFHTAVQGDVVVVNWHGYDKKLEL